MRAILRQHLQKLPGMKTVYRWVHILTVPEHLREVDIVREWAERNIQFARKYNLAKFSFSAQGASVTGADGLEYGYDVQDSNFPGGIYFYHYGRTNEKQELQLALDNIPPGGAVFDIGANIGVYSMNIASRIEGVTVHAFEPVHRTWESLKNNVARNQLSDRVHCNKMAMADTPGEVKMTSALSGANFVITPNSLQPSKDTMYEAAQATTVDTYVRDRGVPHLDFIKCDVEGLELSVFKGATESLRIHKPHILVEIIESLTRRQNYSPIDLINYLESFGYELVTSIYRDKFYPPVAGLPITEQLHSGVFNRDQNGIRANFFFSHKSKSPKFLRPE